MWNVKCIIIPVIIEATGITTKVSKKFLKAKPDSLQSTAVLGTSHAIWKVLQFQTEV
jgi:hypothetical protein